MVKWAAPPHPPIPPLPRPSGKQPPDVIRIERYKYRFTRPGAEAASTPPTAPESMAGFYSGRPDPAPAPAAAAPASEERDGPASWWVRERIGRAYREPFFSLKTL